MATQTSARRSSGPPPTWRRSSAAFFRGRFLSATRFNRDGTGVATPVWFVSDGRRLFAFTDLHSPKVRRIRRYFDALAASSKKLVWFEHSGHEPLVDEPATFNDRRGSRLLGATRWSRRRAELISSESSSGAR